MKFKGRKRIPSRTPSEWVSSSNNFAAKRDWVSCTGRVNEGL